MSSLNYIKENLPHRRIESWKYTNLNFLKDQSNEISTHNLKAYTLCGKELGFCKSASSAQYFNQGILSTDPIYRSLDSAKTNYILQIDETINSPVIIEHDLKEGQYTDLNLEIKLSNDKVSIIEIFKGDLSTANTSTKIISLSNQHVEYVKIQALEKEASLLTNTLLEIKENSSIKSLSLHLGSKLTRENIHAEIQNEGGHAEVHGLYQLSGTSHVDTHSFIHHQKSHTTSDQLYKSILDDSSRGVFTGMIRVEKDAQKVESAQLNKNMLIGDKAQANSRPQLEIYADDVKCAHGSTTGQLNMDELFYLQSRNISKDRAKDLLLQAYLEEVFFKIENKDLRDEVIRIYRESL